MVVREMTVARYDGEVAAMAARAEYRAGQPIWATAWDSGPCGLRTSCLLATHRKLQQVVAE